MEKFEYTRFKTFQLCPKKHDYIYNQGIKSDGSFKMQLGTMFHEALDAHYSDEDERLDDIFKNYVTLLRASGEGLDEDLLKYCFQQYVAYYAESDKDETVLASEAEFIDPIDADNEFYLRADRIIAKKDGLVVLRDTKTTVNKLKYTYEDVLYNQQLLTYIPFIENEMHIKVDAIEIDEVRLAKLQPTPINLNGKPSGDKSRLELTTIETYTDTLDSLGLTGDKAYAGVLIWLEQRGHPLFRRVTAQVLDPNIVQSNLADMYDTYKTIKAANSTYRNKGFLCKSCEYKDLCQLDMSDPESPTREILVHNITG